jgi:hypothetical protein
LRQFVSDFERLRCIFGAKVFIATLLPSWGLVSALLAHQPGPARHLLFLVTSSLPQAYDGSP